MNHPNGNPSLSWGRHSCLPRPQSWARLELHLRRRLGTFLALPVLFLVCSSAASAQKGFPFQDETLRYSINWPSGLSLGDATFSAAHSPSGWTFHATLTAGIPGFQVADKYEAVATPELCSVSLDRDIQHGTRKTHEKTTFDQKAHSAHRTTLFPDGGGQSDFDVSSCARDVLSFIYFARREMGQGRMAPAQDVYLGSAYSVRLEYTGPQTIPVSEKPTITDHVVASVKGPKADFNFEIFFARDAARTPLVMRLPLSTGTFSVELVR